MCKLKTALKESNFEALATMQISENDLENQILDARAELQKYSQKIEELTPRNKALQNAIARAKEQIEKNQTIIENAEKLLEMIERGEWVNTMLSGDYD